MLDILVRVSAFLRDCASIECNSYVCGSIYSKSRAMSVNVKMYFLHWTQGDSVAGV